MKKIWKAMLCSCSVLLMFLLGGCVEQVVIRDRLTMSNYFSDTHLQGHVLYWSLKNVYGIDAWKNTVYHFLNDYTLYDYYNTFSGGTKADVADLDENNNWYINLGRYYYFSTPYLYWLEINVKKSKIENYIQNIAVLDLSNTTEAEIASLEGVNTSCKNLESLTLNASGNVTYLDLSGLTKLNTINFNGTEDKITYLDISDTNVKDLDWSKFTNLKTLKINGTSIENLDVSKCLSLETLDMGNTNIANIDLSNNVNLSSLNITGNSVLITLDVSNTQLSELDIESATQLQTLNIKNTNISNLDVSGKDELVSLEAANTNITSLDVSNHSELKYLSLYDSMQLETLNVEGCTQLEELLVAGTALTTLDVSSCEELNILGIRNTTELIELDIDGLTKLTEIRAYNTGLTQLDVSANPELEKLEIYDNANLTTLDVSNTKLTDLDVSNTPNLKTLNVDGCVNLETLIAPSTNLTNLNFTDLVNLRTIDVSDTDINEIDVSTAMYLEVVDVSSTPLAYMKLPDNFDGTLIQLDKKMIYLDQVEVGYDKETQQYWVDLTALFPGLDSGRVTDADIISSTSKFSEETSIESNETVYDESTGKVYGVIEDSVLTYTYNADESGTYTIETCIQIKNGIITTQEDETSEEFNLGEIDTEVVLEEIIIDEKEITAQEDDTRVEDNLDEIGTKVVLEEPMVDKETIEKEIEEVMVIAEALL